MPRQPINLPPQRYLRECFDYDRQTGELTWRVRGYRGHRAGRVRKSDGHRTVVLDRRTYRESRIIFKLMTGRDPIEVDHRSRKPGDNRWRNLREARRDQNNANTGARRHNRLGVKGVCHSPNGDRRFRARITINRRSIHLGVFDTVHEAHIAYLTAAHAQWQEFASG